MIKRFSSGENPERNLPGRYAFVINVCNSNDAYILRKCTVGETFIKSKEKIYYLNTWKTSSCFKKNEKRIEDSDTKKHKRI